MSKSAEQPWVQQIVYAVTFGLLLVGLFYAGYMSEALKGVISELNRAVLVIGFMLGAYATSSYLGLALAKWLTHKKPRSRP